MEGSLLWISTALSTIRTSTSPRLSVIKLSFARQLNPSGPVQVAIKDPGIDLGKVADEVARIEREFEGTLRLTVFRDPEFEVVSDMLDVRPHSCRAGEFSNAQLICFLSFLIDRLALRSSEWSPVRNRSISESYGVELFGRACRRLAHSDCDLLRLQDTGCFESTRQYTTHSTGAVSNSAVGLHLVFPFRSLSTFTNSPSLTLGSKLNAYSRLKCFLHSSHSPAQSPPFCLQLIVHLYTHPRVWCTLDHAPPTLI